MALTKDKLQRPMWEDSGCLKNYSHMHYSSCSIDSLGAVDFSYPQGTLFH